MLVSFHAGRHSNLLFQHLRRYRKSQTMTQIVGKEYGVNQEMLNVNNLIFANQSICFLRQEKYPAYFRSSGHFLNEALFKR